MATPKPSTVLNVRLSNYQGISNLITAVVTGMTANANFTTPSPLLATLTADQVALDAAIAQWGPVGNRGSHLDLLNLRAAALTAFNDLLAEASYVQNIAQIAAGNDYVLMASIISSSGFPVKNPPTPQGLLGQPQNVRRVFEDSVSLYHVKLKWSKPLGLLSPGNVKNYIISRIESSTPVTPSFINATPIATTTKGEFIDTTALTAQFLYYYIQAVNTNGPGAESTVLFTQTPV